MQLHYLPGSPFARVARIVALELAAPCDFVEDSGFPPKGIEALNPAMQVPTLVDGARTVFGTKLIAEYLMACHRTRAEPGRLAGEHDRLDGRPDRHPMARPPRPRGHRYARSAARERAPDAPDPLAVRAQPVT